MIVQVFLQCVIFSSCLIIISCLNLIGQHYPSLKINDFIEIMCFNLSLLLYCIMFTFMWEYLYVIILTVVMAIVMEGEIN